MMIPSRRARRLSAIVLGAIALVAATGTDASASCRHHRHRCPSHCRSYYTAGYRPAPVGYYAPAPVYPAGQAYYGGPPAPRPGGFGGVYNPSVGGGYGYANPGMGAPYGY